MQNRRRFSITALATLFGVGTGMVPAAASTRNRFNRGINLPTSLKLKYLPQVDIRMLPPVLSAVPGRSGGATLNGLVRWPAGGRSAELYDLTLPLPVSYEDRSHLLTPTVSKAFSGATKVGSLYLTGDPAIIYIEEEPGLPGPELLAHKNYSYELTSTPKAADLPVPSVSNLPVVGSLYVKKEDAEPPRVLVLLTPTIVQIM
ncbi:hypothetical protein [uncultured Roseobacter sp.]|uniref:hypothetical protein n=1 Tax=uncultured Roseobacter sp. TaxID=114847 RepID=UPI002631AA67|nr:hypothetical protein [uncultured Roseobacter sp.]